MRFKRANFFIFLQLMALMLFITPNSYISADDNTINGVCPGEIIEEINEKNVSVSHIEKGWIGGGGNDRYRINFIEAGSLEINATNINPSANENYKFYVSRGSCGDNDSDWNIVSAEYGKEHYITVDVNKGDTIYIRLQSISTEPNSGRHNYGLELNFNVSLNTDTLPNEDIPDRDAISLIPICETFKTMFQTREKCDSSTAGAVNFVTAGQTLDGSKNIIVNAVDKNLTTCSLTTPSQIKDEFETCGDKGDCIPTLSSATKLELLYDNPPDEVSVTDQPAPDTSENVTLSGEKVLTGENYNSVTTGSNLNTATTFSINDGYITLKINSLKLSNNNTVKFTSKNPYSLEIGEIGVEGDGKNNTISNDSTAKNIKIKKFRLSGETKLNLASTQTIQIEELEFGKDNSDISLISQYVKINNLAVLDSGTDAKIYIKADYIDIGDLNLGDGATLTVEPFTKDNRVLFRSHFIKSGSPATIKVASGNYYTKVFDIPGADDKATIIATDAEQTVNIYIDGDFKPSNSPAINSLGNNGKFGTNPPVNFMISIKGDFDSGGNGATFNSMIYAEGDVNLGNPTYIRGAVSAKSNINIGQGQFFYDEGIYNSRWGLCSDCVTVQWQKELYTIFEDFEKPIPPKKTLNAVVELLDGPVGYDITIYYRTIDGTAIGGSDFPAETNATVILKAGETNVTVPIEIYNDTPIELDENFFVEIYNPLPTGKVCLNENNKTQVLIKAQTDVPICFEDNFNNGLDDKWRVLKSSGNFVPQIVSVNGDNRLRITPGKYNISTAITKDYKFNTKQNLIIVEFDYYAYGGCWYGGLGEYGADGIVNVLFDSSVGDSPEPGGFGGSMGYAQKGKRPGFEGGWIGLGVDEYGNFGNCNENRVGGLPNTSCDSNKPFNAQDYTNTAVIRGDLNNNDRLQGYEFLAGVRLTESPLNQAPVAKKRSDNYFSGRYKMTVDARDPSHLYIKLQRKLKLDGDYKTIIEEFDAKDPKYGQGETPEYVRYAITGGTGAGCNNHELGWIKLKGNCQLYSAAGKFASGPFVALDDFRWDFYKNSLKDGNDRAISTKEVNGTFKVVIASLGEDGITGETKYNVDVKYALFRNRINPLTAAKLEYLSDVRSFNVSNEIYKLDEFSTDGSYSDAHIRVFYCAERNSTNEKTYIYPLKDCGIVDNDPEKLLKDAIAENTGGQDQKLLFYYESDHFAFRPSSFEIQGINSNSTHKAGEDLNITFKALNKVNLPTLNFGEYAGVSFLVEVNESKISNGCSVGEFDKPLDSDWNFEDGQKSLLTKYFEVGNIYVKISDLDLDCQKRFANIDCNDKNITGKWNTDTGTAIGEAKVENIKFIPDHFDINGTFKDFHIATDPINDMNFTYLSKDLNMSSTLKFDITAKTKDGNTTTNYNKECYAKDLDFLNINYLINSKLAEVSTGNNPNPGGVDKILFELVDDDKFRLLDSQTLSSKISTSSITADVFNTEHNGSAKFSTKINFDRKKNVPVQPFFMNIKDINATDVDGTSSKMVDIEKINKNITFLYGKVKSSQEIYDYISESSIKTPISILIYNLPAGVVTLNKNLFTPTSEYDWFLNTIHNPINDGSVKLSTDNSTEATVTPNPAFTNGLDESVTVTAQTSTRPLEVNVNLTGTDDWLIFNSSKDAEPIPFYKVRFIGGGGWSGHGKTGNVVDTNTNSQGNKRLEW